MSASKNFRATLRIRSDPSLPVQVSIPLKIHPFPSRHSEPPPPLPLSLNLFGVLRFAMNLCGPLCRNGSVFPLERAEERAGGRSERCRVAWRRCCGSTGQGGAHRSGAGGPERPWRPQRSHRRPLLWCSSHWVVWDPPMWTLEGRTTSGPNE